MRWTMLILNLLAAAAFVGLGAMATVAQRTHAYSTYRELEINHAIVEKPRYANGEPLDVVARLRNIGGGGRYYSLLGYLGAGACVFNGLVFFLSHRPGRPKDAS